MGLMFFPQNKTKFGLNNEANNGVVNVDIVATMMTTMTPLGEMLGQCSVKAISA